MGRKKRLPQMAGGSASALTLSRPAQALRVLRPVGSLSHPEVTFVTRLRPSQLPNQVARQLPDLSTIIRVKPSFTDDSRLQGALPPTVLSICDKGSTRKGTYSITASARESRVGEIVRPSALAAFRLITSSNLAGRSIGSSPGRAPLRILSTYVAARRIGSAIFGPYVSSNPSLVHSPQPPAVGMRLVATKSAICRRR